MQNQWVRFLVFSSQPLSPLATLEIREHIMGTTDKRNFLDTSTQGLQGLARLFLGRVADEVLRQAPCPVWTVNGLSRSLDGKASEDASHEAEMPPVGEAKKTQQPAL